MRDLKDCLIQVLQVLLNKCLVYLTAAILITRHFEGGHFRR